MQQQQILISYLQLLLLRIIQLAKLVLLLAKPLAHALVVRSGGVADSHPNLMLLTIALSSKFWLPLAPCLLPNSLVTDIHVQKF